MISLIYFEQGTTNLNMPRCPISGRKSTLSVKFAPVSPITYIQLQLICQHCFLSVLVYTCFKGLGMIETVNLYDVSVFLLILCFTPWNMIFWVPIVTNIDLDANLFTEMDIFLAKCWQRHLFENKKSFIVKCHWCNVFKWGQYVANMNVLFYKKMPTFDIFCLPYNTFFSHLRWNYTENP